ncbi:MAG TPA: LytTR family DNA-binding domain-containing protein [Thermoanaerobaculia bacterium]|nr:LytTR family DNA-binding domain-containing protein [Thermoanaerobaculia bacterium]
MNAINIVVAEDEAVVARRLARQIMETLGPKTAVTIAGSVSEAIAAVSQSRPDILVLDLNLEGRDGFELLRDPVLGRCPTIVVSAHTDRALEAYELGIRDFVPKPFGRDRLAVALHRAFENGPRRLERLAARDANQTRYVAIDEILYVRADGARSEIVLAQSRVIRDDRMLDRIQALLPSHFERVHRSFLVDVRKVECLSAQEGSRYAVTLRDGTTLPVGRTRVASLRARLG